MKKHFVIWVIFPLTLIQIFTMNYLISADTITDKYFEQVKYFMACNCLQQLILASYGLSKTEDKTGRLLLIIHMTSSVVLAGSVWFNSETSTQWYIIWSSFLVSLTLYLPKPRFWRK